MNPIQEAYDDARARELLAEHELQREEAAYIRRHEIKNRDGSAPARLEDLDDPERALNFIGDFYCIAQEALVNELETARKTRRKAENALIAWGLTALPSERADILQEGIFKYAAYRCKAVQLFMELPGDGGRK